MPLEAATCSRDVHLERRLVYGGSADWRPNQCSQILQVVSVHNMEDMLFSYLPRKPTTPSVGWWTTWLASLSQALSNNHTNLFVGRLAVGLPLTILPSGRRRCLALAALVCWLLALLAYQGMSSPNMTDGDAPNCAVGGIDSIASDRLSSALL